MRVLVVEDERRLAAAVRRGLQAEGFAVDLAHDGEDGLHLAREGVAVRGLELDVTPLESLFFQLTGEPQQQGRQTGEAS